MNEWSVVKMDPMGAIDTDGGMAYCFKSPVGMIDFPMLCVISREDDCLLMIIHDEEINTLIIKDFTPDQEVMAIKLFHSTAKYLNSIDEEVDSQEKALMMARHCLHNMLLS